MLPLFEVVIFEEQLEHFIDAVFGVYSPFTQGVHFPFPCFLYVPAAHSTVDTKIKRWERKLNIRAT